MNSGAYIEQLEVEINALTDDNSALPDSQITRLCEFTKEMSNASGRDFQVSWIMKRKIEEAGFVDVQEQKLKLPLGHWPTDPKLKDIGRFFERFYKTGLQGWLMQICTQVLGVCWKSLSSWSTFTDSIHKWTADQVNAEVVKAFQEINARQQHFYFPL